MLILGQSGEVAIIVKNIQALTVYNKSADSVCILAWSGNGADDCYGLGDYADKERAKQIIKEIWQKYGEYLHRKSCPAILKGSVDLPEEFWILPKIYEMPNE